MSEPSRLDRFVSRCADGLLGRRHLLSVLFGAMTLFFGYSATNLKLDPGFLKLIPIKHPYMKTMFDYLKDFNDANILLVNLRWKGEGEIYNPEFMGAMQKATDDVFFIPGVNRTQVSSIFTPSTYYIEITESGFNGEPVVPAKFSSTPEQLERVRHNIGLSGQIGLIVSNDQKAALIRANLQEVDTNDPAAAERFYRAVMGKLGDIRGRFESQTQYTYTLTRDQPPLKAGDTVAVGFVDYGRMLRFQQFQTPNPEGGDALVVSGGDVSVEAAPNPDYSDKLEVNIIGFSQLLADVIAGLVGVFAFFALAFVITLLLLFFYTRSIRMTVTALIVALLPVVWLLGLLPLIGLGIDPMSILVPFLIFSIGVSHAVQMTNAWRLEAAAGASSIAASHASFCKLFVPGAVALLTTALGFAVIMVIDIPIVHELGITASLGVLLMIITNKMILPIILSHLKLEESSRRHSEAAAAGKPSRVWSAIAQCAQPRTAGWVLAAGAVLLAGSTWMSRGLVIGDSGRGVPELHDDSRYNLDNDQIGDTYNIGTDLLTVIAEARDFSGDSCLHYEVVNLLDRFELFLRGVEGVQSVTSVAGIGKLVISAFSEGTPRFRTLPRSQAGLSVGSRAFDPNLGLNNESCRAIKVMVFTRNHDGTTIAHVVKEIRRFIADNPVEGVNLRLASGNVGVMAATNEAVSAAEVTMLLAIFGSLTLLCLITFKSVRAVLCIIVPLTMVSVFCNALMAMLGIGLKVATLPVVALGVGVGIDYGIYLFERIQHEMDDGRNFHDAFYEAMRQRGTAAVFTALTMGVGVGTWVFSALKFQADMGLLLAFMFVVNMLGAICLLPALGAWFFRPARPAARLASEPLR